MPEADWDGADVYVDTPDGPVTLGVPAVWATNPGGQQRVVLWDDPRLPDDTPSRLRRRNGQSIAYERSSHVREMPVDKGPVGRIEI